MMFPVSVAKTITSDYLQNISPPLSSSAGSMLQASSLILSTLFMMIEETDSKTNDQACPCGVWATNCYSNGLTINCVITSAFTLEEAKLAVNAILQQQSQS